VAALLGLIGVGLFLSQHGFPNPSQWSFSFAPSKPTELSLFSAFAVATVGSMFAADAWNNVTFVGSEIKNPQQNLPKALFWGVLITLALYCLANVAYLNLLPFDLLQNAPEDRVATAAMSQIWGSLGAIIMASVILVSTSGCLNGMILAGARVYYAMAKDNLFFSAFGRINARYATPIIALVGQWVIAAALTLSGSYGALLDYTMFTTLLFYIVTIVGMFRLAQQNPEQLQMTSWKAYVIPVLYLVMLCYISFNLAIFKQEYTLPGLGIVSLGIPIYYVWKAFYRKKALAAES
jgi:APA family basic amino acid/polyamine antiporter